MSETHKAGSYMISHTPNMFSGVQTPGVENAKIKLQVAFMAHGYDINSPEGRVSKDNYQTYKKIVSQQFSFF